LKKRKRSKQKYIFYAGLHFFCPYAWESASLSGYQYYNGKTGNANFYIGMPTWVASNTKGFTGIIDDVGVWNRALTQEEVTGLYLALTSETINPKDESAIRVFPNPVSDFFSAISPSPQKSLCR